MTTKTQTIFEAVKTLMQNGTGKVESIHKLGLHVQNVKFTAEQNAELKQIKKSLMDKKFSEKMQYAKELIENGTLLYKAMEMSGINVSTLTKPQQIELKTIRDLNQKTINDKVKDRFNQTVELLNEGLPITAIGQIVGYSPSLFMKRLNPEQLETINSLKENYKKMGSKRDIESYARKVEKVEERILTEKEEHDLIDGKIQIGFKKSDYIIGLVKRLFPSDPTTSIDEKGYLMAGNKGFWKIGNKAWKGVKLVEITN